MISKKEAIERAIAKGGSLAEIERQAQNYVRQVKSVPFKNMIVALNMHAWSNSAAEWERLAAALSARQLARKAK